LFAHAAIEQAIACSPTNLPTKLPKKNTSVNYDALIALALALALALAIMNALALISSRVPASQTCSRLEAID